MVANARAWTKLAFTGPDASLYTYGVMSFGPVNVPVIFICMMFNINGEWYLVAKNNGVLINDNTNTKIIADTCLNWAISKDQASSTWRPILLLLCAVDSPL